MNCHVNHSKPNLNDLNSIHRNLTKVLDNIRSNDMPPAKNGYSPLDNCKKEIFETWVNQKTPEKMSIKVGSLSACQQLPNEPNPDDRPLSQMHLNYDTLVKKILQPKCINCHNPDSDDIDAAGVLFFPYQEILNREQLWSPPVANSKLFRILTSEDPDGRMPPPSVDSGPLTADELDFITRWIENGKPN